MIARRADEVICSPDARNLATACQRPRLRRVVAVLDTLIAAYAAERQTGERFDAFVIPPAFLARATNAAEACSPVETCQHIALDECREKPDENERRCA
jgi:hypothetical protein